ncbi:MAG: hypothetical protein ABIJ61_06755 [bacterium]
MNIAHILARLRGQWLDLAGTGVILLGSVLSYVATRGGLVDFITSSGANTDATRFMATALTIFIQALVLMAVLRFRQDPWRRKPLWLGIYAAAAFFSVTFAMGYWVDKLEGARLARESADATLSDVDGKLRIYATEYMHMQYLVNEAEEHCRDQAEIESKFGNTCGEGSPKGEGPRWTQRMKDAEFLKQSRAEIADYARLVDSLVQAQDALIRSFNPRATQATEAGLRKLVTIAGQTRNNTTLRQLKTYLADRTANGGDSLEQLGVVFSCPDIDLETLADKLIVKIDSLPELPAPGSIDFYEGANSADAVRAVFDEAISVAEGLISIEPLKSRAARRDKRINEIQAGAPPVQTASVLDRLGRMPIAMGLAVDLFIFFGGLTLSRRGLLLRMEHAVMARLASRILDELSLSEHQELIKKIVFDANFVDVSLSRVMVRAIDDRSYVVALFRGSFEEQLILLRFMDLLQAEKLAVSIDPGRRAVQKHRSRINGNASVTPPYAWMLERSLSPYLLRTVVRIMEMGLVIEAKKEDYGLTMEASIATDQLSLF